MEYVQSLKDTGIPLSLFDPLETSYTSASTANNSNNNPLFSTPRRDSESLSRAELINILQNFALNPNGSLNASQNPNLNSQNPNQNQNQGTPPTINPIPRPVTRSQSSLNGSQEQPQGLQPPRGRGRGRGAQPNVNNIRQPLNFPEIPNFPTAPLMGALNNTREIPFSGDYFNHINGFGRGSEAAIRARLNSNAGFHTFHGTHPYLPRGRGRRGAF